MRCPRSTYSSQLTELKVMPQPIFPAASFGNTIQHIVAVPKKLIVLKIPLVKSKIKLASLYKCPVFEPCHHHNRPQCFVGAVLWVGPEPFQTLFEIQWGPQFFVGFNMGPHQIEQSVNIFVAMATGQEGYFGTIDPM